MKTEELKNQGLTDEQIQYIMSENSKDIKKYKDLSENQKTQLDEVNKQLMEANKQIDDFKEMDIDGIKKAAEDYKQKYEQTKKESEEKAIEMQYDNNLNNYMKSLEMIDDVHLENLKKQIKEKGLKFEEGKLLGGDDFIKNYKEKHPNAFKSSEKPVFTTGVDAAVPTATVQENILRKAMGLPEKKI